VILSSGVSNETPQVKKNGVSKMDKGDIGSTMEQKISRAQFHLEESLRHWDEKNWVRSSLEIQKFRNRLAVVYNNKEHISIRINSLLKYLVRKVKAWDTKTNIKDELEDYGQVLREIKTACLARKLEIGLKS